MSAFGTYADLKTQIAAFANRSDVTSQIPAFIELAESRIFFGSQEAPYISDPLRVRDMEVSAYTTISSQTTELPDSFLERRRLYIVDTSNYELSYMPPDQFWASSESYITGRPRVFTIEGGNIVVGPIPTTSYTAQILYYKKYTALSADADTNWLLQNSPGVYLDGALLELWSYLMDPDKQEICHKRFAGRINGLNMADKASRNNGSAWVARPDVCTP